MQEQQPLPEAPESYIITPESQDRFTLLFAESQACDLPLDDTDRIVISDMGDALEDLDGQAVGLAAVQVGYPKRIFVIRRDGRNEVFVNPVIIAQGHERSTKKEGCLSLPNMAFRIARPKSITLSWFDDSGGSHERTFVNFWARVICHEMDHLNGTILADHQDSVLVKDVPRAHFKHQEGSIIRDAAFQKRLAKRRAQNKRARKQRAKK